MTNYDSNECLSNECLFEWDVFAPGLRTNSPLTRVHNDVTQNHKCISSEWLPPKPNQTVNDYRFQIFTIE